MWNCRAFCIQKAARWAPVLTLGDSEAATFSAVLLFQLPGSRDCAGCSHFCHIESNCIRSSQVLQTYTTKLPLDFKSSENVQCCLSQ